jgi:pSer/pThr/pTyr-binding forkhead associated (FHA) protein
MDSHPSPRGVTEAANFAVLALRHTRQEFLSSCPGPFLVSTDPWRSPEMPKKTDGMLETDAGLRDAPSGSLSVMTVQKTQIAFGNMITIGRTANNDIVIDDSHISRFHAFFRAQGDGFELVDAGSRNGTWCGHLRILPKTAPSRIVYGSEVRFAGLKFLFLDASACWTFLRSTLSKRQRRDTVTPRAIT